MSSRSVPSTYFCRIVSNVASWRRCAFLWRALCNSIMGINPSGLLSGSSVRPSIKFLIRESTGISLKSGSRSSHLHVISIIIGVPDNSLRRLVSSSIRPWLRWKKTEMDWSRLIGSPKNWSHFSFCRNGCSLSSSILVGGVLSPPPSIVPPPSSPSSVSRANGI